MDNIEVHYEDSPMEAGVGLRYDQGFEKRYLSLQCPNYFSTLTILNRKYYMHVREKIGF